MCSHADVFTNNAVRQSFMIGNFRVTELKPEDLIPEKDTPLNAQTYSGLAKANI